ncbi:MAG: outer membrane protein assembly factor BamA [Gemmatimonadetes bacterium]|nr:MAG: outer membrane protein assembly factor BamA [Gemmatimonadota bacterium]PYP51771.1 MAG: outer membrane protein assembly factor BamA [Gemmatimonadota bacterium]
MRKIASCVLALAALSVAPLYAQEGAPGVCSTPESIVVTGSSRSDTASVRATAGLSTGAQLNVHDIQTAIKALYATGQFDDVQIICRVPPTTSKASLVIQVKERPILTDYKVIGADRVSPKDVKEKLAFATGSPVDPGKIAKAIASVDSLYESRGYYLATVKPESTVTDGKLSINFRIDEGRRLAISGIRINGNTKIADADIVGAMDTKPEGFLWTRNGELDDAKYAQDLAEKIPQLYASRGYIDFRILKDTLIVDRAKGKGLIDITVSEGPRYTVGNFEVIGNRRFSTEQINSFYPFGANQQATVVQKATGLIRRSYINPPNTFDEAKWDDAQQKLMEAYNDEGYIYANIRPVVERVPTTDSVRKVNLRWEIDERSPAIVNRIEIAGNDYTHESCIREQIVLAPGQVFNRNYLIRSYQNIGNLNFFETPMPAPETRPSGDQGDVDIVFNVKEKRTGNINFGASMGQGTGLGGFIGLDQPNLLGRCKRAQLQWQFGRFINDFSATYSDPNIRQSRISGSFTAYHSRSRFQLAELGGAIRTGGQVQLGFPVPQSIYTRLFVSYGGEKVKYESQGLLGTVAEACKNCFRSTLGLTATHDTRTGLPFPADGGLQSFNAQFNGGPLGGTAAFQRYTTELRSYAPIGRIGGSLLGGEPMMFVVGLSARAGAVFGNTGPFFYSQAFSLGGTQYGEPLRGYDEFSITPSGYNPNADQTQASRSSFGNAFFVGTGELGLRISQSLYLNTFFEGGNVWNKPREFDPTRLFRSFGFGVATLSPLGPLGVDIGYGFDKIDTQGRPAPGWKLHFKLGQFF